MAKQFGYELAPRQQDQSSLNRFFRSYGLTLFAWGNWDKQKAIDHGYLGNSDVYSIINRITRTAAIAPFRVYRIKDQKKALKYKHWTGANATDASIQKAYLVKEQAFEEDLTHPLNEIIAKPNRWQGWDEFIQTSMGFKLITGNFFWLENVLDAGANEGKLTGLYNLPPQHMTIVVGDTMWNVVGYELTCGELVKFPASFITHSRYWNPEYNMNGSHLWGLSPLRAGSKDLTRSNKSAQRGVTILDNAGAAGVLFNKASWDLGEEQAAEMKRRLNEDILGVGNAGKISLANGDIGYLNFGLTAVEMDLINQEKYSAEKLANLYGAPPGLFMANANATDNNIKAWNKQLISNCCVPALAGVRESLMNVAAKRYPNDPIFVDYDLSVFPELQEDLEKTANVMQKSYWLKGNEKRLAMGFDEDSDEPMMNTYLVPTSVQPINNINPDALQDELRLIDEAENRTTGG